MTEKIDYEESFDILVEDIFGKMIEEKNSDQKNIILDDIGLQIDFIKKEISKNSNILSGKIYRIEDFIKNDIELEDVVKRIEKIDKTSQDLLEFIDKHSVDIKNNLSDLQSSAEANNSKNTSEIIETLKKCSQELIAKDESLSSLLQSSDLSRKEIAKETMQVISEVGQLLNNNLDTLLSTIDENRQFTDDTYQKFTEVLQREKEILLTHSSNLEELFSEKNNYNISRLLEEMSVINKLICSKYDSLLQQIDESSQRMDKEFTLTKETMESQYKELNSILKSTIDHALIKSNDNYEISQKKMDKISLFTKALIVLNCLILIAVIFVAYGS
ncbi:hypothetical protein [uncultured Psychrobacter sp.]|uniref:hypothetical protein n=1 Tax=uncultured Psychrobacter sp. TaxID=259303 RepID=UPI002592E137|nr:hypothetical protein [uncultured Psychrobacter sp.]